MASVLSGSCVCSSTHASLSRFCAGNQELARLEPGAIFRSRRNRNQMVFQILAGRNVCVACFAMSKSGCEAVRSFGVTGRSARKLRTGRVLPERVPGMRKRRVVECSEFRAMLRRQNGRGILSFAAANEGGTEENDVDWGRSNAESENCAGGESSMGGESSFAIQESASGTGVTVVENGTSESRAQSSVSENMDTIGKMVESATERLVKNSGALSGGSAKMPQVEGNDLGLGLGDAGFRRQLAMAVDAGAALEMIAERAGIVGGVVGNRECSKLILAALAVGNIDLAFSVLQAMRSSVIQRRVDRNGTYCSPHFHYLFTF